MHKGTYVPHKPGDLCSIPRSHIKGEGENQLLKLSSDFLISPSTLFRKEGKSFAGRSWSSRAMENDTHGAGASGGLPPRMEVFEDLNN